MKISQNRWFPDTFRPLDAVKSLIWLIFIRKHKILMFFKCRNEIKLNLVPLKGYTGPQIGPKWTKIGQNGGIFDILEPEDAIKPLNMNDFYQKI